MPNPVRQRPKWTSCSGPWRSIARSGGCRNDTQRPKDMAVMTHTKQLIAVIALSLAGGGLSACGGEHVSDVKAREPIAVTVVPVVASDSAERLEAGGVVAAQESASVS